MNVLVILVVGVLLGLPVGVVFGKNYVIRYLRYDVGVQLSPEVHRELHRILDDLVRD